MLQVGLLVSHEWNEEEKGMLSIFWLQWIADVGAIYLVDTWIGSLSLHLNLLQFGVQKAKIYIAQFSLQPAFCMGISFSQLDIFSRDLESLCEAEVTFL